MQAMRAAPAPFGDYKTLNTYVAVINICHIAVEIQCTLLLYTEIPNDF